MSTTIKYRYNFFLISKICFTGKPFPYFILFHLSNVAFYCFLFFFLSFSSIAKNTANYFKSATPKRNGKHPLIINEKFLVIILKTFKYPNSICMVFKTENFLT